MIRFVALVLAAVSASTFAAPKNTTPGGGTDWTFIAQDVKMSKYFVDMDTIKRERRVITAWLMTDLTEPAKMRSGTPYQSSKQLRMFNCDNAEFTNVAYHYHEGNMMTGKTVFSSNMPADFAPAKPGTVEEALLRHVCSGLDTLADSAK